MNNLALILIVVSTIIAIIGDIFVKKASLMPKFSGIVFLILGFILYGSTALTWFFVMREVKLSSLGVIYSLSTIVFLALISVLYFNEKINIIEILGIILAIISIIIMYRFA